MLLYLLLRAQREPVLGIWAVLDALKASARTLAEAFLQDRVTARRSCDTIVLFGVWMESAMRFGHQTEIRHKLRPEMPTSQHTLLVDMLF